MKLLSLKFSKLFVFSGLLFGGGNVCLSATITSFTTGVWASGSTWVGGVAPVAGDEIIIASTHTVTIDAVPANILSITIQANAVLNSEANTLTIATTGGGQQPYYTNNGIHNSFLGGKIASFGICNGLPLKFDGNGTINCDIDHRSICQPFLIFVNGSNLTINGNITNTSLSTPSYIRNNGNLTIVGDIYLPYLLSRFTNNSQGVINHTGNIHLLYGAVIENKGIINTSGNLTMTSTTSGFSNAGGTFIIKGDVLGDGTFAQKANSLAKFGGQVFPVSLGYLCVVDTGGFSEPNTIEYNGFDQVIKPPGPTPNGGPYDQFISGAYSNLILSNSDIKTMDSSLVIYGNLTIKDAAALDVSVNNYSITMKGNLAVGLAGNWYDSSVVADPFVERTGTVTFSGDSAQLIIADSVKKETFYNLVLNDTGTVDNDLNVLTLHDSITVLNTFTLSEGILNLNKNVITLASKADTALIGGSDTAYIRSEDPTGLNQSCVQWNVKDSTGVYTIPFGVNNAGTNYYIPFTFNVTTPGAETSPGSGYLSVSTYSTSITNTPLPISPDMVTQAHDPENAVDRFWQIDAEGYGVNDKPGADLTFTYPDPEKPLPIDTLVAQHWNINTLLWDAPASAQTYTASTTYTTTGAVTITGITSYSPWTLAKKNDYLKCPEIQKPFNSTICYGDTIILSTLTSPTGFYTQMWSPATGLNSTTGSIVSASPDVGSITYTVSGNDGAGCYNNQTINIAVNPLPTLTGTATTALCYGSTSTLTLSGANTYTWNPATYLNTATTNSVLLSQAPVGNITYTVTGYNEYACSSTHTISVTVHQLPIVNAGIDQYICLNDTATLSAIGTTGNYTWTPATYYPNNTGTSVSVVFPSIADTYTCTVTIQDNNTCITSDTVLIHVVDALIANAGQDITISCGTNTTLSGSGGLTFSWSPANGITTTNSSSPEFDLLVPGSYTYSLIVASGMGCVSAPDDVVITVDSIQAHAGEDQSICSGSTANIEGTGGNAYSWAPQTGLNNTSTNSSSFSQTAPGSYSYYLSVSNGTGCTSQPDAITITVIAIPTVSAGADITIRPDQSDTLHAEGNAQSYSWTPDACSNCLNPVVFPSSTTQYILTASNAFCTASDTVIAHYVPYPCDIYIPNAFSPNNDGENDKVQVYSHCLKAADFAFRIFDRWGTLVFETYDQDKSWDGTYGSASLTTGSGNEKNTAVFVYQLQATTINLDNISKKGNISLVR